MSHWNRMGPYLLGAAVVAAVLIAFGAPLSSLLPFAVVLACPLMMFVMMRGMAGMHGAHGDRSADDRAHDPTRNES